MGAKLSKKLFRHTLEPSYSGFTAPKTLNERSRLLNKNDYPPELLTILNYIYDSIESRNSNGHHNLYLSIKMPKGINYKLFNIIVNQIIDDLIHNQYTSHIVAMYSEKNRKYCGIYINW